MKSLYSVSCCKLMLILPRLLIDFVSFHHLCSFIVGFATIQKRQRQQIDLIERKEHNSHIRTKCWKDLLKMVLKKC